MRRISFRLETESETQRLFIHFVLNGHMTAGLRGARGLIYLLVTVFFHQSQGDGAKKTRCIESKGNSICCSDYLLTTRLVNSIIRVLLNFQMMSLWSSEE